MKYIFDFDGVLFDTEKFKKRISEVLEKAGVPDPKERYEEYRKRSTPFSLKEFLGEQIDKSKVLDKYEEILRICQTCVNLELIRLISHLGSNDCYIVTEGDKEFQLDKIKRSAIGIHFRHIKVVPGSKKDEIERICQVHSTEPVMVVENKKENLERLDETKFPNLRKIWHRENRITAAELSNGIDRENKISDKARRDRGMGIGAKKK